MRSSFSLDAISTVGTSDCNKSDEQQTNKQTNRQRHGSGDRFVFRVSHRIIYQLKITKRSPDSSTCCLFVPEKKMVRKSNKNKKKSWKRVDVSQVDEHLEDERLIERLG